MPKVALPLITADVIEETAREFRPSPAIVARNRKDPGYHADISRFVRPMLDYAAFISYSHASDLATVQAFQQVVQTLGKRWWARRAITLFRDDTHLSATPELWPSIVAGLEASQAFILLATPKAAESPWVQQEVDWWLANRGPERVYLVVLDGTLEWDRAAGRFTEGSAACPPALHTAFAHEPKYIDLREYRGRSRRDLARDPEFQSRAGDIAAALHGKPKVDLMGEEVRQQRQLVRVFAVLGVVLLAALGAAGWMWVEANRQRIEAEKQRDVAERNFSIAQDSVEALVGDLSSALANLEGMRLEAVHAFLGSADRAVRRLLAADPENRSLVSMRVRVYMVFGDLLDRTGNSVGAIQVLNDAMNTLQTLPEAQAENADTREQSIVILQRLGRVTMASVGYFDAAPIITEGLRLAQLLADSNPEVPRYQRHLMVSLVQSGSVAERLRDYPQATAHLSQASAIARGLEQANPGGATEILDIIASLQQFSGLYEDMYRPEQRREALAEAQELAERLVADYPANREARIRYADILYQLGGLDDLQSAVDFMQEMHDQVLDDQEIASRLQYAIQALAHERRAVGELDVANGLYQQVESFWRARLAADPQDRSHRLGLASILRSMAEINFETRHFAEADLALEEAEQIYRALIGDYADDFTVQQALARTLRYRSDQRLMQGNAPTALPFLRESVEILRSSVSVRSTDIDLHLDFLSVVSRMAPILLYFGEEGEERHWLAEALEISIGLFTVFPNVAEVQRAVAISASNAIGTISISIQHRDAALSAVRTLISGAEPDEVEWLERIELNLLSLADPQ